MRKKVFIEFLEMTFKQVKMKKILFLVTPIKIFYPFHNIFTNYEDENTLTSRMCH